MASQIEQLHFLVVPLMSQSHLIPMTDFAKLLAQRGLAVTIITTPLNAARFQPIVDRAVAANLKLRLVPLKFPCSQAGLPPGSENMDTLTSPNQATQFFQASSMLQDHLEKLVSGLEPRPSCFVTSNAVPWMAQVGRKFNIPTYVFNAISCFSLVCSNRIDSMDEELFDSEKPILLPNLPHRIELTKSQLPRSIRKDSDKLDGLLDQMKAALLSAEGVLVNSFEEMELGYVEEYRKVKKKTWCIGPVSLCNKELLDKFGRGNKNSVDEHRCLSWLDNRSNNSVIYTCFGSLCHIPTDQLIEIGLGLESSNRPFIWIIRETDYSPEIQKWLEEERFEERNKEKGLIIHGWAPQILILSHPAVGGFLTHCGWNSTLEGISAGVPMITWPMFAEQFYNEKVVTQVLRIGVRISVEVGMKRGGVEEKGEVMVKREEIKRAVDRLMDEGEGGVQRRERARELEEMAKRAVEEGGSSHWNMTLLIQDVIEQMKNRRGPIQEDMDRPHPVRSLHPFSAQVASHG
ncbi:UDP-glycosyltransferase 73C4-like [Diospyros lotus]|uniref:UDP-glycosyltransferase 73C4-like n=1 Tax=Diospyros lotus TaxID=55363 RepID=UPI0022509CCA|nr:UDP-glycosyltransferase 73C4-like [Diospyros lotus]